MRFVTLGRDHRRVGQAAGGVDLVPTAQIDDVSIKNGGAEGIRTPDPKTASLVLSQLSYSPTRSLTVQGGRMSCQELRFGAGGGSRTRTPLRALDFESSAAAITPLRPSSLMSVNFPSQHCTASRPSVVPSATRMQLREATESVRPSRVSGKGRKRSERWSALSHSEVSRRNERARRDALPSIH